jgi:hypothetical protein
LEPRDAQVDVWQHGAVLFRYPAAAHGDVCARVHGKHLEEPGPFGPRVVVVA